MFLHYYFRLYVQRLNKGHEVCKFGLVLHYDSMKYPEYHPTLKDTQIGLRLACIIQYLGLKQDKYLPYQCKIYEQVSRCSPVSNLWGRAQGPAPHPLNFPTKPEARRVEAQRDFVSRREVSQEFESAPPQVT